MIQTKANLFRAAMNPETVLAKIRFSKTVSPEWVNEGRGWTNQTASTFASGLGLKVGDIVESDDRIDYRQTPPQIGPQKVRNEAMPQGVSLLTRE